MTIDFDPNPALYHKLSAPHVDIDAARDAVQTFFDGVKALREQCGIADATIIVEVPYLNSNGTTTAAFATYHLGNLLHKVPMTARAYGAARADAEMMIGDIIAEGRALGEARK